MDCDYQRTLSGGKPEFPEFLEAIEAWLEGAGLPMEVVTKAMIVFDEVISNILTHGASGTVPTVTVRLRTAPGELTAEVLDDGLPFDPLSRPDPDTSLPVEDRPIGGLGIHLVRELMDSVGYSHDGQSNRLRFSKNYAV